MTTTEVDVATRLAALEDRVARLEGVDGVLRLFQEYRRLLDLRDFAAYSRLFADDGEWVGDLGSAKGPAEIEALLVRTLEVYEDDRTRTYHLVANPVVEVDRDRATATSMWCFLTRGEGDRPVLEMVGHYVDTLVREDGTWKFLRRAAHRDMPYVHLDA
jgi:hypothetical protein